MRLKRKEEQVKLICKNKSNIFLTTLQPCFNKGLSKHEQPMKISSRDVFKREGSLFRAEEMDKYRIG
jgi:hypothetical protein